MTSNFTELQELISRAMGCDRGALRARIRSLERLQKEGKPFDRSLSQLKEDVSKSVSRREERVARLPKITYDTDLPVVGQKDKIIDAIREHQVVVICGETGSGKSTQLPKICLEMGRGIDGLIGHTQPRRIAARSVSARIADELSTPLGTGVGFKIRFNDITSPGTYIKLMTDGILLAETQGGKQHHRKSKRRDKSQQEERGSLLHEYDTLIIDEAHERSLNIDFLMGYIKRILPRRPDLRVIITSATLDVQRFAEFFGSESKPAPIIEVSGRTYPVEVRYRASLQEDPDDIDVQRDVADACEELCAEGPGDILVFLPTERDIREASSMLNGRRLDNGSAEIVPLFGRLSEQEQNRVFAPHNQRRIVVATNVAESSLTVPGIRYVVDAGLARISRFSPTSKVQRLPIEPISQASANQRKGRCGRVGPGICVRLYSAEDFGGREEFTAPEIQRSNLASVLLQMKALRLGEIQHFPFIDPPSPTAVRSGLKTLFELGAVDESEQLTSLGKTLARLPVDPRIGRMILGAAEEQCLEEVLIIASALEIRDPRERPIDKQQQADTAHEKFRHEDSDFLSILKLWDFFERQKGKLSGSKLRKACHQNFLSFNRLREWQDLRNQLRDLVTASGLKPTPRRLPNLMDEPDAGNRPHGQAKHLHKKAAPGLAEDAIHRALLPGLLSNLALKSEGHEYLGAGNQKLFLWPGSGVFKSKPQWIMAAELVETTRRFARTLAAARQEWIEKAAGHLTKHSYGEPHWHDKSDAAMAWEKVLLFGLTIVPRRRCRLAPHDPVKARELFIQHALIEGDYRHPNAPFYRFNLKFKEELREWQAKLRQGKVFVGEEAEFAFYDERLPDHVVDGATFETWRKTVEATNPQVLFLTKRAFGITEGETPDQADFPNQLQIGGTKFALEYHLQPGTEEDGVTIIVPASRVPQVSQQRLDWLVPGLLEEKVAGLIRTLPKQLRTHFVPVPDSARDITPQLKFAEGDLGEQLCLVLRRLSGEHIRPADFETSRLPDHLRFLVRVVDESGKVLSSGRDLASLKKSALSHVSSALQDIQSETWSKSGLREWSWGELPKVVQVEGGGGSIPGYPAIIDEGETVGLKLFATEGEAERQTRRGLVRLFFIAMASQIREQLKWFPNLEGLLVQGMALPEGKHLRGQLMWRMAERCLAATKDIPRTPGAWNDAVKRGRNQLSVAVQDLVGLLEPLLSSCRDIRKTLSHQQPPALQPLVDDLREQLDTLITPGFFEVVPWAWLVQYPRYFKGMSQRWSKAVAGGFQKDRRAQSSFSKYWERWQMAYHQLCEAKLAVPPHIPSIPLQNYRWMLEEFRISLFAQKLGAVLPVSEKRLDELWARYLSSERPQ